MTDSSPHRRREIRMHSNILTQEDVVEAHRIQLAAIAAANQTLDDSTFGVWQASGTKERAKPF